MMRERRESPRRDTKLVNAVTAVHGGIQSWFSRTMQAVAGSAVSACGAAALYVTARRAVADHATTAMDWAFFALGTLLLVGGLGISINGPFWRALAKAAKVADDTWDAIRGKSS